MLYEKSTGTALAAVMLYGELAGLYGGSEMLYGKPTGTSLECIMLLGSAQMLHGEACRTTFERQGKYDGAVRNTLIRIM